MKVLYVVPYTPNLIRVRPYNLLRALSARGHQITLLTTWTNPDELEDIEHLKTFLAEVYAFHLSKWRSFINCLRVLPTHEPLQAAYCWQPELKNDLHNLVSNHNGRKRYDLVHIEHLRGVRYGLGLRKSKFFQKIPIVWDSVDSITRLFGQTRTQSSSSLSRLMAVFEYDRTRQLEAFAPSSFDRTLVTSQTDMEAYLEISENNNATSASFAVVPNGVDLNYFQVNESTSREPASLVISGKMSYHANRSMVNFMVSEIMPKVWKKRPDVKLWIVGKDPPKDIQNLGDSSLIHVTGTVEDIRPYLQHATAAVVPLVYGTGVQNKVLESMACGTPVITTPLAISALDVQVGRDLLVANHPREFADEIITLLEDPQRQRSLSVAGRRYVEDKHRWESIASKVEDIYREVITERY
jgi:glycosyltransferase involved in cell wall biosynthesis